MAVGSSAGKVKRVVFPAAIIRSMCTKAIPSPSEISEFLELPVVQPARFDAFALQQTCGLFVLDAVLVERFAILSCLLR